MYRLLMYTTSRKCGNFYTQIEMKNGRVEAIITLAKTRSSDDVGASKEHYWPVDLVGKDLLLKATSIQTPWAQMVAKESIRDMLTVSTKILMSSWARRDGSLKINIPSTMMTLLASVLISSEIQHDEKRGNVQDFSETREF